MYLTFLRLNYLTFFRTTKFVTFKKVWVDYFLQIP